MRQRPHPAVLVELTTDTSTNELIYNAAFKVRSGVTVHTGRHATFSWVCYLGRSVVLDRLLAAHPNLVVGRNVAITSLDSGPLCLSKEELESGWSFANEVALSPRIVRSSELPRSGYDEWLIFDEIEAPLGDVKVFVNHGGFSLVDSEIDAMPMLSEFWNQLCRISPYAYVAEGDNFVFAAQDERDTRMVEAFLLEMNAA